MLIEMINCDSTYSNRARGWKCYVYIAYFSIDLAITNAYIFHCLFSKPSFHNINDFHLNLATKLISLYNSQKCTVCPSITRKIFWPESPLTETERQTLLMSLLLHL